MNSMGGPYPYGMNIINGMNKDTPHIHVQIEMKPDPAIFAREPSGFVRGGGIYGGGSSIDASNMLSSSELYHSGSSSYL